MKTMEVNLESLRQKSVFIATPMYGGMCHGQYAKAIYETGLEAVKYGVTIKPYFMYNESLIQRARNYCVDEFMQSGMTHLLFIDADIHWRPQELLMMLNLCNPEDGIDVICGPYPKKEIAWEKVVRAVEQNRHVPDINELKNFVGDFVFNIGAAGSVDISDIFRVQEAGTGFMMIHRSVFERIQAKYPKRFYKPDHIRSERFDGRSQIYLHFDCKVDPESKRYLSEDYYFCHEAAKAGAKIWMAPWVKLEHYGTMEFGGSVYHLAMVGASLTAGDVKKETDEANEGHP